MPSPGARIVSFSGIDGSGKSTQITLMESWMRDLGLRSRTLTFWDDVVVSSRYREMLSKIAFQGDQGIGSPEKPLHRRDKNVASWPVLALRYFLYFADALSLRRQFRLARKSRNDVVIFDRYLYDELANLPLENKFTRAFVLLMLKLTPAPDAVFILDADPVAAFARKPEYPLDFLRRNRAAYLQLAQLAGKPVVIQSGSVEATRMQVRAEMLLTMLTPEEVEVTQ